MVPDAAMVERFRADLDPLIAPEARLGIAVSGGPDSLALLALAATAWRGQVEAATVDHALREESRAEAELVARICERLRVPHCILAVRWTDKPRTAIQERARRERYRLLGFWAEEQGLAALVTAHHADDQAETFLMRLARGAGVRGLAAMRGRSVAPGTEIKLLRPLLGWRRAELEQICVDAGLTPARDPSNADDRYERIRIREALAGADWLDPAAIARSAANLADADKALDWAARLEWDSRVKQRRGSIVYHQNGAPIEIVRRIIARAVRKLATEGQDELRGAELSRLIAALTGGGTATLRGVRCQGGSEWSFVPAPERTRPVDNFD
jgi:tRNA(Ile)-lysidine synthase